MRLRELRKEDAPLMLEWMKDEYVVHDLAANFADKRLSDCESFINDAAGQYRATNSCKYLHLAIADDNDEYMGTVSLKNIDRELKRAEFAITVRRQAMGKGYAKYGMDEIMRMAFEDPYLELTEIYWCVDRKNARARRFYDKYRFEIIEPDEVMIKVYKEISEKTGLIWYHARKNDIREND